MPWFKIDDGFGSHPKVLKIRRTQRPAVIGLWTLAGTWSASNLTDGHIPEFMVGELGATAKQADVLVQVGLWERVSDGYLFHDWHDHQPTRISVLERREYEREKKKSQRRAKSGRYALSDGSVPTVSPGDTSDVPRGVPAMSPGCPSVPDPTRPVPFRNPRDRAALEPDLVGEDDDAGPTEQLIAEWLTSLGADHRPPTKLVTQVGQQVADLFADGFPYRDVKRGLIAWQRKGNLGPTLLPNLVHEVRTAKPGAGDRRQAATNTTFDQALAWAADQEQKAIGS